MPFVYAKQNAVSYVDGKRVAMSVDEPWDDSDPFVKDNPDLFGDVPRTPRGTVEQATAAPDEVRDVKRPGRRKKADDASTAS